MRLCWLVEHGGNPGIQQEQRGGRAFHHDRGQKYRQFPFLEPPASRGELTIDSVLKAQNSKEHAERARAWGQSVWEAWSEHHFWAREQVRQWFLQKRAYGL
jgi:hypothetical protein